MFEKPKTRKQLGVPVLTYLDRHVSKWFIMQRAHSHVRKNIKMVDNTDDILRLTY